VSDPARRFLWLAEAENEREAKRKSLLTSKHAMPTYRAADAAKPVLGLEIDLLHWKKASRIHLLAGMTMKQILAGAALLLLTTSGALAQGAPKARLSAISGWSCQAIAPTGCKARRTVKAQAVGCDCVANDCASSSTGNEPAPTTGTFLLREVRKSKRSGDYSSHQSIAIFLRKNSTALRPDANNLSSARRAASPIGAVSRKTG